MSRFVETNARVHLRSASFVANFGRRRRSSSAVAAAAAARQCELVTRTSNEREVRVKWATCPRDFATVGRLARSSPFGSRVYPIPVRLCAPFCAARQLGHHEDESAEAETTFDGPTELAPVNSGEASARENHEKTLTTRRLSNCGRRQRTATDPERQRRHAANTIDRRRPDDADDRERTARLRHLFSSRSGGGGAALLEWPVRFLFRRARAPLTNLLLFD